MSIKSAYDYDDLMIVPRSSSTNSREDVDISVELSDFLTLKVPIIASPMKGIVSFNLVSALSDLGGIGILHRFYEDIDERRKDVGLLGKDSKNFGVSVGISGDDDFIEFALDQGAKIICVDVANGYTSNLIDRCIELSEFIKSVGYKCLLMAGNVVTLDGAYNLCYNGGVDMIRVGIGAGTLCTTRNVTGIGYPQLSAISDCSLVRIFKQNAKIVADGGIRSSGDAVKALAMGADVVMLGTMLSRTYESSHNGIIYGMASKRLQEEYYQSVKSVEGMEKTAIKDTTLETFVSEFSYGIKSACTYVDAKNLKQLRNVDFVETGKGSLKSL